MQVKEIAKVRKLVEYVLYDYLNFHHLNVSFEQV